MSTGNPLEQLRRRMQSHATPTAFAALAEEHRRAGRFAEAIAVCREGLERYPAYVSARVTLGRALLDSGDVAGRRGGTRARRRAVARQPRGGPGARGGPHRPRRLAGRLRPPAAGSHDGGSCRLPRTRPTRTTSSHSGRRSWPGARRRAPTAPQEFGLGPDWSIPDAAACRRRQRQCGRGRSTGFRRRRPSRRRPAGRRTGRCLAVHAPRRRRIADDALRAAAPAGRGTGRHLVGAGRQKRSAHDVPWLEPARGSPRGRLDTAWTRLSSTLDAEPTVSRVRRAATAWDRPDDGRARLTDAARRSLDPRRGACRSSGRVRPRRRQRRPIRRAGRRVPERRRRGRRASRRRSGAGSSPANRPPRPPTPLRRLGRGRPASDGRCRSGPVGRRGGAGTAAAWTVPDGPSATWALGDLHEAARRRRHAVPGGAGRAGRDAGAVCQHRRHRTPPRSHALPAGVAWAGSVKSALGEVFALAGTENRSSRRRTPRRPFARRWPIPPSRRPSRTPCCATTACRRRWRRSSRCSTPCARAAPRCSATSSPERARRSVNGAEPRRSRRACDTRAPCAPWCPQPTFDFRARRVPRRRGARGRRRRRAASSRTCPIFGTCPGSRPRRGCGLLTADGRLHLLVDPRYEAAAARPRRRGRRRRPASPFDTADTQPLGLDRRAVRRGRARRSWRSRAGSCRCTTRGVLEAWH